jgi:hypothetical protein
LNGLHLVITFAVGIGAGFMNVIAAGGSLMTIPFMVMLGLDVNVANATNRIAAFLQNVSAAARFYKDRYIPVRYSLSLTIPAMVGTYIGTVCVIELTETTLRIVAAMIIIFMAVLLVASPRSWEERRSAKLPNWGVHFIFLGIGFYNGFLQAGIGYLILAALVFAAGLDLIHALAAKVVIIAIPTTISIVLFWKSGLIHPAYGFTLAAGSMVGGFLGARFAVLKGNRWIRFILIFTVCLSAGKMLFDAIFG